MARERLTGQQRLRSVFGSMVSVNISGRSRPPGVYSSGSDCLVGKGHNTLAPEGTRIVIGKFLLQPGEVFETSIDGIGTRG